jgi:asparagine synthase (glutamine-hydrolysing)
MLWTTPESLHERLPLYDPNLELAITSDARIDNRDELIALLRISAPSAGEVADSELILAAYSRWGERCVEKLIGDFAFAIWDRRKRSLFCARDPLGVKHFYYYYKPGELFVFASEVKALLSLPFVPRALDELSIAYHLLPVYDDKSGTPYRDILRMPGSHYLVVDRRGLRLEPAWSPDLSKELRMRADGEYAEAFREIFTESVRCRLRSAFPVGSMLSGGLDSSSISCAAANLLSSRGGGPLHTFSAIWPSIAATSPKIDERPFMEAVLSKFNFDAHFVHADEISPLHDWDKIYWHQDGPFSAPNIYMDWAIFKSARSQGARVLLGGTDGDSVVSYGYEDLETFARRGRWLRLYRESRALEKKMPRRAHRFNHLFWKMGLRPLVAATLGKYRRILTGRSRSASQSSGLPVYARNRPINPAFARRIGLEDRLLELQKRGPREPTAREAHWGDVASGDWSYILETFEKAGAAHSLDLRYPFFDRRVIEFCLALPPGQKIQDGYTRSILRRAMSGILPPEVQWRVDKGNLSAGVTLKLLEYEKETLEEFVRRPGTIEDYVELSSLQEIYRSYSASPLRKKDEAFSLMLALNLGFWLDSSSLTRRQAS